jgi:hypothetical protein
MPYENPNPSPDLIRQRAENKMKQSQVMPLVPTVRAGA